MQQNIAVIVSLLAIGFLLWRDLGGSFNLFSSSADSGEPSTEVSAFEAIMTDSAKRSAGQKVLVQFCTS